MSFADVEARTAASVNSRLSNATATIGLPADMAGAAFDGIFDADYEQLDVGGLVSSAGPAIRVADAVLPAGLLDALAAGDAASIEVRGVTYQVVEPKPDGTGITVLRLRK